MRRVWEKIGFMPSSFELPLSEEDNREADCPIAETERFTRKETVAPVTATDKQRYVGLTNANICLDVEDEEIKKFVMENVNEDVDTDKISIIREKKKAIVTINHSLSSETVQQAMMKINFSDCKTKFFGLPLYCRPIRDITPEKISQPSTPAPNPLLKSKEKFKKIPGLPPSAQSKAKSRENERDKKQRKEKEKKQKVLEDQERLELGDKENSIQKSKTAFDVLMNAQKTERSMSVGSSPCLQLRLSKRGSDHLSSPSSPELENDFHKKSREEQAV